MSKRGRPSTYNTTIATTICSLIAQGNSLVKIVEAEDMPDYATIYRWRTAYPEFRENLARAREDMADYLSEQVVDIADEIVLTDMPLPDGNTVQVIDKGAIQRNRLRCDMRLEMMQLLKPKTYRKNIGLEHSGEIGIKRVIADI